MALALRDDPRVRGATRRRVQEEAKRLGYIPDPLLSALSAYRHSRGRPRFREALGWITSHPSREGWRTRCFTLFHSGASQRAAELGYRLEEFWLERGRSGLRSSEILANRGIRGILLCPLPDGSSRLELDWSRFAAVTFGYSLVDPLLDRVATAHYQSALLSVQRLWTRGCRRIGLAIPAELDVRTQGLWKAGFRIAMEELTGVDSAMIFQERLMEEQSFVAWCRRNRLDAVLSAKGSVLRWIRKGRSSHRRPVTVAFLNLQERGLPGCLEPSDQLGRTAVEMLTELLRRGHLGLPTSPRRVLLDGTWIDD